MTEAAYHLTVEGDLEIAPSLPEDCRPTQEFKQTVQEVIEARNKQSWTKERVPLSVAIDRTLNARGITR